jgi:hypothetical protein
MNLLALIASDRLPHVGPVSKLRSLPGRSEWKGNLQPSRAMYYGQQLLIEMATGRVRPGSTLP